LRDNLLKLKVQFERNVSFFFQSGKQFTKKEIDISAFSADKRELEYAIELKYPRNGQYPEQMFIFCKDIIYAEELAAAGFHSAGLVIFADDHLYYQGSAKGIYGFFRDRQPLHGRIQKPTGRKDDEVILRGTYLIPWKPIAGSLRFTVVEVGQ